MINSQDYKKIVIFCPPKKVTGGPEALHQLSHKLRAIGLENVFMHYLPKRAHPKAKNYSIYESVQTGAVEDHSHTLLIIPESMTNLIKKYPKSRKIIWWLSVDFYQILVDNRIRKQNIFQKLFYKQADREYHLEPLPDVFHWAQSYRSGVYLKNHHIPEDQIDYVCDYINPVFLESTGIKKNLHSRRILYNPKKGKKEMHSLMLNSPELEWVPIKNMNAREIRDLMAASLLYVDFGENPGRDKMLRESVSQDCCIISGRKGSSQYQQDLMIPEEYKFDFREESIPEIIDKIKTVLENYKDHIPNFLPYKNEVLNEEAVFENKLKEIFGK